MQWYDPLAPSLLIQIYTGLGNFLNVSVESSLGGGSMRFKKSDSVGDI